MHNMSSVIRKPLRRFIPILKNCYAFNLSIENSYSCHYVQREISTIKLISKVKYNNTLLRTVSSSNVSKTIHTNGNNPKNVEQNNALDDPEFQNILSDFAKDFDVGSDSEQVLDEIRKSLDEPESKKASSEDKDCYFLHKSKNSTSSLNEKFKEFSDKDSFIIPSYEEQQTHDEDNVYHISQETDLGNFSTQMALKRGIKGVYDIEEIIDVLKKENMDDIVAISVPKELHYTDYLVIATAKSPRHCKAICERVLKLYKLKKHTEDPFAVVEGEKTSDWKAIDMGNIVLHIFLGEMRTLYDIESLWLFDSAFDRGGNLKDDPMYPAIEQHMAFFNSINENLAANPKHKTV